MTIKIDYDRKERQYNWIDPDSGEMFAFPSGQKHEAFKFAVSMLEPDLHTAAALIIQDTPQIERIVWKAVELVVNGSVDVYDTAQNGIIAMVASSDQYGRYAIQETDYGHTCNCISFTDYPQYDQLGNVHCKHTLAVKLHGVARSEF